MDQRSTTISVSPLTRNLISDNPRAPKKQSFTGVIARCQLLFESNGSVIEFNLPPDSEALMVGRIYDNPEQPIHIDLTHFNGRELGVSRCHARFERIHNRLYLRDLGSTNGTFVNGRRMSGLDIMEIGHGDQIEFGRLSSKLYIKAQN